MLDLSFENITEAHKRVIQHIYDCNPSASLLRIAEVLNNTPDLATCFVTFTPKLLKSLGFKERRPKAKDNGFDTDSVEQQGSLTQSRIRVQLEARHASVEERLNSLLMEEVMTQTQVKMFEALAKIDEKLVSQILDLMHQESAPLLPQAQIIRCLRKLGVPDSEIKLLDVSIEF